MTISFVDFLFWLEDEHNEGQDEIKCKGNLTLFVWIILKNQTIFNGDLIFLFRYFFSMCGGVVSW